MVGANKDQLILTKIGSIPGSRIRDVKVKDDILYVLKTDYGLITYNISDPTTPDMLGRCTDEYIFVHALVLDDGYAYVADYEDGLEIVNITNPADLTIIGDYSANVGVTAGSTDLYKSGDLVFLASQSIGLEIINCSDPFNPVKIGSYYENHNINRVYSSDDQVFISEARNGFKILNITDTGCVEIFHFRDSVSFPEFYVHKNLLYTTSEHGITIFDISDFLNVVKVGEKAIGASYGFTIKEMLVYVSSWDLGLQILDISDLDNIEVIAQYTDGGESYNVDVSNDLVFVADVQDGIEIIQKSEISYYSSRISKSSTEQTIFSGFELVFIIVPLLFLVKKRIKHS
jgi:hypothetical protein